MVPGSCAALGLTLFACQLERLGDYGIAEAAHALATSSANSSGSWPSGDNPNRANSNMIATRPIPASCAATPVDTRFISYSLTASSSFASDRQYGVECERV
jgi:hypothetical protein